MSCRVEAQRRLVNVRCSSPREAESLLRGHLLFSLRENPVADSPQTPGVRTLNHGSTFSVRCWMFDVSVLKFRLPNALCRHASP
jgi:hypothetical protein